MTILSLTNKEDRWFLVCWLLVSCWLLGSAFLTHGEYGDGYHTIVNGRFLYANAPDYYIQRGPLAALAMGPIELLRSWVGWAPLDVRPYHFYSALLHSLYLLGCWILLKYSTPKQPEGVHTGQLLAFIAAILSITFYAFAPFLNHDIIPGLLFILMIYWSHRWLNQATRTLSLWLVLLGTAVTFIKQTFAFFWVIIILYALIAYLLKWDNQRVTQRKLAQLFALACISGASSWLGWSLWISLFDHSRSFLTQPLFLIEEVFRLYSPDAETHSFSQDLYLRNLHNYGITAMLLVIPGLVAALSGQNTRLRMVAVCWIISVIIMQIVPFKEVRYLLFLTPLTAVLILPIIQRLLKQRLLLAGLILLTLADQTRGWSMLTKQLSSTANVNITQFFTLSHAASGRAVISRELSFIYMADSPLDRDRYHGIYHISAIQAHHLYEGNLQVAKLTTPQAISQVGLQPGDQVYLANATSLRAPPWAEAHNTPYAFDDLLLTAGDTRWIELVRKDNVYVIQAPQNKTIMYVPNKAKKQAWPVITQSPLSLTQVQQLYGDVLEQNRLRVLAIVVQNTCYHGQCTYDNTE